MKRWNAVRFFRTEEEARKFAKEVNSDSWGWMIDVKTGRIEKWHVDYDD